MKNRKRLIAGMLAAFMMITSVPAGTVYAAEDIVEEDVKETEETVDEGAQDDDKDVEIDEDDVVETFKAIEDVEDIDVEEIVTNIETTVVADEEVVADKEVIDNEEVAEQVSDEDEEIIETEEIEVDADLLAATSVDYDAVEAHVVKQLRTERKKNSKAAEITIDVSSYKIPGATNDDMLKLDNAMCSLDDNYADLYFLTSRRPSYQRQQNIVTKITFIAYTNLDDTALQKGIKTALATVNNNMSDFQKIVVLHDYLVMNCTYDKTTEHCDNIYGALVEGHVKCDGYANTYKYLLEQVGIECYLVRNAGETHGWNLVKLDGEYYHVDITNDDPDSDVSNRVWYTNLLKSDNKIPEKWKPLEIYKKYGEYVDIKATSTLYDNAEWKKQTTPMTFEDEPKTETYTITYILNGGINNSENPSTYEKGTAVQFKDPTKEGYTFDGWYIDAELTAKIAALTTRSSGNKTIYAKWIKIETTEEETTEETPAEEVYTITYVLNGGVNNSENPSTYIKGTGVQFKDATREGYEFGGWYIDIELTAKIKALTTRSSGDKTIYAKWIKIETTEEGTTEETSTEETSSEETAETYTITYVLNGGVNNSENPTAYTKGTRVEFKDPTREGYQFDGWYLNAQFTANQKVAALSKYSSGDKTIYAKWIKNETTPSEDAPKTYKVIFDVQGRGTAPAAYTDIEAGSTIARPVAPSFDGYRFDGWYKNAACTKVWDFETDTVQANTTLYAKWIYESNGELDARDIPDMYYTGSACKPEVDVYDEDTLLKAGKDYQVKYYNNVNANVGGVLKSDSFNAALPYVEIIGKGNYTGTVKVNFNILKASISDGNGNAAGDVTLKVTDSFAASNKVKKPFSSIKYVKAMKQDVDFTLRLTTAEGKELSGAVIPAGLEGTFTLEIIGKNNYEGAIERTIYVADKASLPTNTKFAANTINVDGITDKVYTGKALVQENVRLSYGGKQLVNGMDYTVAYTKNVNKGTATMTFKGIERAGFSGSFKKTFKIVAADIASANHTENLSATYSKSGAKPAITLTNNGKRLVNGKDYTLSYANNKAVGSGTVVVKGKGNYTGSFSVPFSIVKADLNNLTVKTAPVAYNANKAADYEYKPAIKLMDGKTALKAGVDYQIAYVNNTQAAYEAFKNGGRNTPCAVIMANDNSAYKLDGQIVIPLPVYRNKFTKNNVSVTVESSECVYTGYQVKPSVKVSYMGTELTEGRDYTVSYGANNVSGKNKGSVTISGIGPNYGGDVVVKFEISRKTIRY